MMPLSNAKKLKMGLAFLLSSSTLFGAAQARAQASETKTADKGAVEEITVVARKRAENVQSVPIPTTVITAKEIERQNLNNFTNFQYKLPSFSVYLTNPKQLNLGVRGIGNNGFNTDGIDGSVGIFVDGVYSGRQGMVSSDFNDVADIELLRGPQGTLFGKNTTAGAVLINTKKPGFTPDFAAEITGGSENLKQVKLTASGPIVADKLAVRVSAFYNEKDGNYPNVFGGPAANARGGYGARVQLLGKISDTLTVRVIAAHSNQDFNTMGPITFSVYNPAALQARMTAAGYTLLVSNNRDRKVNINSELSAVTKSDLISGTVDWDLGNKGSITSISAWQAWSCFTNNDNDYTQLDALHDYGSCNRENQFSQEVRWASVKGGAFESVAGLFLSRQYLGVDSRIRFGNQYYIWAANPSATAFPTFGGKTWAQGAYADAVAGVGFTSLAEFHTDTNALFGNVTWHPDAARKWAFDFGLRQTWEDRDYSYNGVVTSNTANLSQAQINALSAAGANAQLGQATDDISDSSLSGQFGINYKLTPNFMAYVTAARGYKSKGFNLLPLNATNPDAAVATAIAHGAAQHIDGETADNIEAGFKSQWFNRRATLNVTVFDVKVDNYQANQSIGVGNTAVRFLANVGSMRSKGVEVESEARITDSLHLKGLVAYNEATYDSFPNSVCPAQSTALTCDLTGRQVAWAPKWTANLTLDYTHSFFPGTTSYIVFDTNYRSEQNTTITLDPAAEIKGYALSNLRIGTLFRDNTLDVQLWSENLFNKAYYTNLLGLTRSTGLVQGYAGNPRSYGVTLKYHF
jgi:iron complex outermembrane recepter protein